MPEQQRRLAAIMFTNIIGYTALMGTDEDRAFEVLHLNLDIHTEFIQVKKRMLKDKMSYGKQKFNYKMN